MTVGVHTVSDLEYANVSGVSLQLDLHLPDARGGIPVIVYFHGGGWRRGSRKDTVGERLRPIASHGVGIASVSYRFSDAGIHPTQLHDAKAAVRWLRANGTRFGLRTERIGAFGASAGGWIALMLATTGGKPHFDGTLGNHAEVSSAIQATATWFPTTNLATVAAEREAAKLPLPAFIPGTPPPTEAWLLGLDNVAEDLAAAQAASPVTHASGAAGPVLLMHGTLDGLVNFKQSTAMHDALKSAGKDSQLLLLDGANHEDPLFQRAPSLAAVAHHFIASL